MFFQFVFLSAFSFIEALVILTGISDISEFTEETVAKYESIAAHPLPLNRLGRASLSASGLFSSYQVESLLDYRRRNGDILSVQELSCVDGFNSVSADCLSLFLDFRQADLSSGAGLMANGEFSASGAAKLSDDRWSGQWVGRGELGCTTPFGEFTAAGAARSAWSESLSGAETYGWNVAYTGNGTGYPSGFASFFRECVNNVTVGNFNARFGQGLALWSGSFFTGSATPASVMRKPSGITPYGSYSTENAFCGVAARLDIARVSVSPFVDFMRQKKFGANVAWNHRYGEIGITVCEPFTLARPAVSVDFQQSVRGSVIYGEASLEAMVMGARIPFQPFDLALQAGCSSNEHNVTTSMSWLSSHNRHNVNTSLSASFFQSAKGRTPKGAAQLKLQSCYTASLWSQWTFVTLVKLRLRALTKYSCIGDKYASSWPGVKYSVRENVKWECGRWQLTVCAECQRGVSLAVLGFAEGGFKQSTGLRSSAFLQVGAFRIDNWDDRIYIYRRDAPQSFNSPAMYGRGCWAAAFASVRPCRFLTLYLRADVTTYPFARENDTHKKTSASAKVELHCSF